MEGAAGPSSSHQTAARRHRPRGGIKHHKKINSSHRDRRPPPAPSCEPCSFGCGCWFKHKCVFAHSDHDHQQWAHEKDLKTALIDIQATKLKARLAGRSARRSALSPLSNNTAPENTVAAHEKKAPRSRTCTPQHPPNPGDILFWRQTRSWLMTRVHPLSLRWLALLWYPLPGPLHIITCNVWMMASGYRQNSLQRTFNTAP